jgi:hypothetical protein
MYGPSEVNLQADDKGLAARLVREGIQYLWLVELGNPQKNDPDMRILREHISQRGNPWPVQRGIKLLQELTNTVEAHLALLCACKNYSECHRSLIAEELVRINPMLKIKDLSS